jgi:hypothetical protein
MTSDMVFYKGQYFTKGDVVSVTDIDGGIYYAQLRGFLTDQVSLLKPFFSFVSVTRQGN